MAITIALAGNQNSGKTTLFNALTGANQYVGNWPGVTVEKKEGTLKNNKDVHIMDLPGIYSLSPYTSEEVVSRNYLIEENPDVILNIVDGTNLERNLYLTTQLMELGIPVVVAINMIDEVRRSGVELNSELLGKKLGCPVIEICATKHENCEECAELAVEAAKSGKHEPSHIFDGVLEHAIAHIEDDVVRDKPASQQRWFAVKVFERDEKIIDALNLTQEVKDEVEGHIKDAEKELGEDAETLITNARYDYIVPIVAEVKKEPEELTLTTSERIDKIVTNRWLGLPIFVLVMFIIYWLAMVAVGQPATDWVNDSLFGDGWIMPGEGLSQYEADTNSWLESCGIDDAENATEAMKESQPAMEDYSGFVNSIPGAVEKWLEAANADDWLKGLIVKGIIGGVGAVLGFVPQIFILFICLSFVESCGYMARVAFILDRIFRRFGLSGKSFIPMLIGTGCGVPALMSCRTIESPRERRMSLITTTFIPCSAKIPIIGMIAGAMFEGEAWVATSAYFVGVAAIFVSGLILKHTKRFQGDCSPFVMELPDYHLPLVSSIARTTWDRTFAFIKKAGTYILLCAMVVWFLSNFGFTEDGFRILSEDEIDLSILAVIGNAIAWIFSPTGFGNWQATVAAFTGLAAKENLVSTLAILYGGEEMLNSAIAGAFTPWGAYAFLVFNLLCAPCIAAMSTMSREMGSKRWTAFAIGYQCGFAYVVALLINQIGNIANAQFDQSGVIVLLILVVVAIIYSISRRSKKGMPVGCTCGCDSCPMGSECHCESKINEEK